MPDILPLVRVLGDAAPMQAALRELCTGSGLEIGAYPSSKAFLAQDDPCRPGHILPDVLISGFTGLARQGGVRRRRTPPMNCVTGVADIQACETILLHRRRDFRTQLFGLQTLLVLTQNAVQASIRASSRNPDLRDIIMWRENLSACETVLADLVERAASTKGYRPLPRKNQRCSARAISGVRWALHRSRFVRGAGVVSPCSGLKSPRKEIRTFVLT